MAAQSTLSTPNPPPVVVLPHNVDPNTSVSAPSWRRGDLRRLDEGFAHAEAITKHHARSFYFCSHTLPPPKQRAAFAVYAFCRYVDDAVDECGSNLQLARSRALEASQLLERVYAQDDTLPPVWKAFAISVATYQIPREYFEILIRGVMMDLEPVEYETWEDLKEYCFHVAGVVGLIMTCIFETVPPFDRDAALERAKHLGTAMQLTNILRDIDEDWQMGRLYVPREDLRRFGITEEDIKTRKHSNAMRRFMEFEIARARSYYTLAEVGVPMLTDDGSRLTVLAMSRVYGGILAEIEAQDLNPFAGRAHTSAWTKIRLLVQSYGALTKLRMRASTTSV